MPASVPTIGNFGERLDLRIKQGSTFGPFAVTDQNPDLTPFDLTGCTFRGQIRREGLSSTLIIDLTCTITDDVNGEWEFGLTDAETETLTAGEEITDDDSIYRYDLEMEDSAGRVIPRYHGIVYIFREVTR